MLDALVYFLTKHFTRRYRPSMSYADMITSNLTRYAQSTLHQLARVSGEGVSTRKLVGNASAATRNIYSLEVISV